LDNHSANECPLFLALAMRDAGEKSPAGVLGVSPIFNKIPQDWGIKGVDSNHSVSKCSFSRSQRLRLSKSGIIEATSVQNMDE
jgi:hypothetical protein